VFHHRPARWLLGPCTSAVVLLFWAPAASATTLTQNSSNAITAGNSIACQMGTANRENSYYRRFELAADHGIQTKFTVSSVTFGIESADDGAGLGQPLSVRLYAIDAGAPFGSANLTPLASQDITVQDGESGTLRTVPVAAAITDPTTTDLVAEVFVPDGTGPGHSFLIGSNAASQTRDSYLRAPACGISDPIPTSSGGAPPNTMHIVLLVDGEAAPAPTPTPTPTPEPVQPSNDFTFGKVKLNKRTGTATLLVNVPGPGTLTLTGKGIVKQGPRETARFPEPGRAVASASRIALKVRPKGGKKKRLAATGKATVMARITFTPTGGTPNSEVKPIRLRKTLPG
jgi:hypothetical protein